MLTDWERVGQFGVDAGLCWIGDPCYLSDGKGPMQNWNEFCQRLSDADKEGDGPSGVYPSDQGLAIQTGWGDGCYSVYVKRGGRETDRRPLGILIVFDEEVAKDAGIED